MHTLRAMDEPRAGVSCISWLFWMREALETCATLADVEKLLRDTDRDRGVMLFAVDGKTNEAAVYECGRSWFRRVDPERVIGSHAREALVATNHCRHQHVRREPREPAAGDANARSAGTVSRRRRLEELVEHAFPEELPHDLCEILGDRLVEMRLPPYLKTIYSTVAVPSRDTIWFAAGAGRGRIDARDSRPEISRVEAACDFLPAASGGQWRELRPEW
jgi:Acyl-coenzyme A:6-aminopenicillanic acid acyl-transferase